MYRGTETKFITGRVTRENRIEATMGQIEIVRK